VGPVLPQAWVRCRIWTNRCYIRSRCDEAAFADWEQSSPGLLDSQASYHRLIAGGQATILTHASAAHASRAFPAPVDAPQWRCRLESQTPQDALYLVRALSRAPRAPAAAGMGGRPSSGDGTSERAGFIPRPAAWLAGSFAQRRGSLAPLPSPGRRRLENVARLYSHPAMKACVSSG
jgi:hypothetical protein